MKKIYIITCDSEEKIDQIINQLITPGVAPAGTENTELLDFTDIHDYMPYSNFSIQVEMTSEAADALRQHPLVFSVEEKSYLLAKLHYMGQNRTLTPVYSSLDNYKHDNWGLARCASLSGLLPFNTNFTHTRTGSGVDVVIIDSGIKSDHPEWRDSNGNSRLQQINWTLYNPVTASRTLNVSVGSPMVYYINGVAQDTVYVATDKVQPTTKRRTTVYDFVLDSSTASHPFFIGSAVNVPFNTNRVSNNGGTTGTVSLTVFPLNNALSVGQSAMYYWCGVHAGMGGVITRTGYNTQADDQYFYSDVDGHGTHCTGTVAGSSFGWATDANIYSMHLNFSDSYGFGADETGIIEAYGLLLNWHNTKMQSVVLSSRPTVTNHSYGWNAGTIYSAVNLQVKALTDAKVHFVHSAGNNIAMITVPSDPLFNTIRHGYYCREPSPCYPVTQWTVQANNPVICVGATGSFSVNGSLAGPPYYFAALNNETLKAEYSNYGKGVSIYAPGTYINSALPTTSLATYLNGALGAYGCGKYSGTSMAGPQVAGILATMLQDMPHITPLSAKQRLIDFSYLGSISGSDILQPYYDTNAYSLSGGTNAVVSQYPPKKIIVPQTAFNFLTFNGLNYSNSTATVRLSNIILDSTVTAVNSSGNMVYSNLPQFSTFADLKTNSQAQQINNQSVYVQGYYATGDGGEGTFTFNSASLSADDAGVFIKPSNIASAGRWIRQFSGNARPEMWGAKGDGLTNDQPAIQRAIRYVELNSPYKLLFDCKTYLLTSYPMVQNDPLGTPIMPEKYWQDGYWKNYAKLDHLMVGFYPNPDNNSPSCLNDTVSANIELIGTRSGSRVTTLSADCTFAFTPTPHGPPDPFPYYPLYRDAYSLNCSHVIGFCRNLSAVKMKDFDLIPFALSTFPPYPIPGISDSATPFGGIVKRGNMSTTQGYGPGLYGAEETRTPFRTEIMYLSGVRFIGCSRSLTTGEGASLPHTGIKKMEVYKCEFLHPNDKLNAITAGGQETLFEPGASLLLFDSITAEGISDTVYQYDGNLNHVTRGEDGFLTCQGVSAVFTNCHFNRYTIETIIAGYTQSGLLAEKLTIPRIGEQITVSFNIGGWRENYIPDQTRGFYTWLDTVTGQILPKGKIAWVTFNGQGGGGGGSYAGNYTINQYIAKSEGLFNTLSAVMTRLSAGLTNTGSDYVQSLNKELNARTGDTFNEAWVYPYIKGDTNWVPSYTKIIDCQFNRGASYVNPLMQNQFANCIVSHDPACNMLGTGNYYISGCLFDQCKDTIVEEINFGYFDSKGEIEKNTFNFKTLTAVSGIQTSYYYPVLFNSCFNKTVFRNNSAFGPFDLEGNAINYLPEGFHQIYYNAYDTWPFDYYPWIDQIHPPYMQQLFATQSYNSFYTDNVITVYAPLCADIFRYYSLRECNTWKKPIDVDTTQQANNCNPPTTFYNVITGNRIAV
jgi:subtilisin family serine protease